MSHFQSSSNSLDRQLRKTRAKTGAVGFLQADQEIRRFDILRPAEDYDFLSYVRFIYIFHS